MLRVDRTLFFSHRYIFLLNSLYLLLVFLIVTQKPPLYDVLYIFHNSVVTQHPKNVAHTKTKLNNCARVESIYTRVWLFSLMHFLQTVTKLQNQLDSLLARIKKFNILLKLNLLRLNVCVFCNEEIFFNDFTLFLGQINLSLFIILRTDYFLGGCLCVCVVFSV